MSRFTFRREPVLWSHLVAAVLSVAVAFGVRLTADQTAAVMALAQAGAAVLSRSQVRPVKDGDG